MIATRFGSDPVVRKNLHMIAYAFHRLMLADLEFVDNKVDGPKIFFPKANATLQDFRDFCLFFNGAPKIRELVDYFITAHWQLAQAYKNAAVKYQNLTWAYAAEDVLDQAIRAVESSSVKEGQWIDYVSIRTLVDRFRHLSLTLVDFRDLLGANRVLGKSLALFFKFAPRSKIISAEADFMVRAANKIGRELLWSGEVKSAQAVFESVEPVVNGYSINQLTEDLWRKNLAEVFGQLERARQTRQSASTSRPAPSLRTYSAPIVIKPALLPDRKAISAPKEKKPAVREKEEKPKETIDARMDELREALRADQFETVRRLLTILLPKKEKAARKGQPFKADQLYLLERAENALAGRSEVREEEIASGVAEMAALAQKRGSLKAHVQVDLEMIRMLKKLGVFPEPGQGYVIAPMLGPNYFLWQEVSGLALDFIGSDPEGLPLFQSALKPFRMQIDERKVRENLLKANPVDFSNVQDAARMVSSLPGKRSKVFFLSHPESSFISTRSKELFADFGGRMNSREAILKAQTDYTQSLREFLGKVVPRRSMIVVREYPGGQGAFFEKTTARILDEMGYVDILPELWPSSVNGELKSVFGLQDFFTLEEDTKLAVGGIWRVFVKKQFRAETVFALKFARSEARMRQVYGGVLDALLKQTPAAEDVVRDFTRMARSELRTTIAGLRTAFEDFIPAAFAEMQTGNTSLAAGFQSLDQVLQNSHLTREALDKLAEPTFARSLENLAEAIRKHEIGGMAPVVFYSPGMKAPLIRFIEAVHQGFDAAGDVTGKNFRITIVSENRSELRSLKTELSKAGMLRGVHFIGDKGPVDISKELDSSVIRHPVFGNKFGVFFPEETLAQKIPVWQRVVRTEIPKEYAILLLPALSRYFAKTATSDINATTLRHALPDLFASAAFRIGRGIAVVAAFLQHIAAAAREIGASA